MATATLEAPKQAAATPAVKRTIELRNWFNRHIEKGRNKFHTERITVTPDLAQIMLEQNLENRKIRSAKLEQIKSDMNAGRFEFNGETIKFSKEGILNDGQHRLQGIIETNRPQDLLIAFGLDRKSRYTVDTGAARSTADHLALQGWPYATTISSVARMVIAYERMNKNAIGRTSDISVGAVTERANNDSLLQECATYAAMNSTKFKGIAKQSIIGFVFYEFAQKHPKKAKTFMEAIRTGIGLTEDDPARSLREKLLMSPRLSKVQTIECFFRAWNAWVNNQPLKQVRVMGKLPTVEG